MHPRFAADPMTAGDVSPELGPPHRAKTSASDPVMISTTMARATPQQFDLNASMRIVVLHGKELLLIHEATQRLITTLRDANGEIEQFSFDGASASLADVLDELRSYGLIQRHKLVIVDSADKFLTREGYRRAMEGYAKSPVEEATLLMRAETWRKGNFDKLVTKVGALAKCDLLSDTQATSWCIEECQNRHGCSIQRSAAMLLVERLGCGLVRLDSELAKLAAFVGSDNAINRDDVAALVGRSREEQAWVLQSAIMSGRTSEALSKLRDLFEVSQLPEVLVMWAISDLLRRLHGAAQLLRQGQSPRAIAQQLRLWGPTGNRIVDTARRSAPRRFANLLQIAVQSDRQSKRGLGRPDRNLERLTVLVTDTIGCL